MIRSTTAWVRTVLCAAAIAAVPACTGQNSNSAQGPIFGGLLTVTPNGGGQATLTWAAAVETGGGSITYNVYGVIGALPADSGKEVFITSVSSLTNPSGMILSGLTPDPWIFTVQAVDASGNPDSNNPEPEVGATIT